MTDPDNDLRWSGLMEKAQNGDRAAYDLLLREIVPFIAAVISRRHRTRDRAEEAVQDVLLTVHRVRHTYDPSRPFKPWLAAIAHRRSVDLLRRYQRTGRRETSDHAAYETFADPQANRPTEVYAETERLRKAVAGLPPQQREAVQLLKLKELSLTEAASLSGRSVAALKVNVHRAINSLRARFKGGPSGG